ncbi:MAG: glycosyltransferase family 4 protein [Gemmatimonadetes bacterium]|nr:glycosyltransferase family 4 protein [Gemmatimonadota bacterium]
MAGKLTAGGRGRRGPALAVSSGPAHIDAAILTVPVNALFFSRALWVRLVILLGAALFLIAALLRIAGTPEWWAGGRGLEVVLLALAAMLTRRFGFPLPGRGFASFVLGVALLGLLLDGWPLGVLTAPAGMLAGDLLFRQLKLGDAVSNAAHLCFGTGLTGLAYEALGGAVGDAALRAASVFVMPSRFESLSYATLEAWQCGVPALVSGASAVLREHCHAGGGGLYYHGCAEFAAALDVLLADPALCSALGARGQRYVAETYLWDLVETRYLEAFRELVQSLRGKTGQ